MHSFFNEIIVILTDNFLAFKQDTVQHFLGNLHATTNGLGNTFDKVLKKNMHIILILILIFAGNSHIHLFIKINTKRNININKTASIIYIPCGGSMLNLSKGPPTALFSMSSSSPFESTPKLIGALPGDTARFP